MNAEYSNHIRVSEDDLPILGFYRIEQPSFKPYIQFLQEFTLAVASKPCIQGTITEAEEIKLQVKARQILKLLA